MTALFYTLSRFPISYFSFQHLALSSSLDFANLMGVKWYVIVVLISLFLIPDGFEHISYLAFWVSYIANCFFITWLIFFLWFLPFFILLFFFDLEKLPLYSTYKSLVGFWLSEYVFSQSFICHLTFPMCSFLEQSLQAIVTALKRHIESLPKRIEGLMFADDSSLGHTFKSEYII